MAKGIKIRRYKHIYKKRRFSLWKAAVVLAAFCITVFLGVSLYQPVRDFVTGKLSSELADLERKKAEEITAPSSVSAPEPSVSQSPSSSADAPAPTSASLDGLRAVYVPQNILQSGGALEFVKNAGIEGVNAAVIDLKNDQGQVLYQTRVDFAHEAGAMQAGAVDLAAVVQSFGDQGLSVVGRICAFRDPLAPYAGDRIAAVKYQNTRLMWLDAAKENEGNPWLNPYAPVAQSYVTDLALEAVSMGVSIIMLDGVQFPEGQGLRLATYGEWVGEKTQDAVLAEFAGSIRQQVEQRGASLFCLINAPDILGADAEKYGGVNPSGLFGGVLGVRLMPALFGSSFTGEGFVLQTPVRSPYETTQTVVRELKGGTIGMSSFVPLLQGYTDPGVAAADNMTYTASEIQQQVQAVTEAGIASYIVCYEP